MVSSWLHSPEPAHKIFGQTKGTNRKSWPNGVSGEAKPAEVIQSTIAMYNRFMAIFLDGFIKDIP